MKTIMNRVSFFFTGFLILAACSNGPEREVEYTIYSTHSALEMIEGDEFQVTASPTTQTFTWESTNTSVATVNSTGLVRAISDGTCFINITSSEGLKRSIPVDVETLITLDDIEVLYKEDHVPVESISMLMGKTMELVVNSIPSNYNERIPLNIIWESSVVTIDGNGIVTPVGFGKDEITASVAGKPSVKKVIPVEILENPITAIQVESELILTPNKKHTVIPVILPLDYGVRDSSLVWKSSDESVVKVTDGEIDPVGLGPAVVTVSLNSDPSIKAEIALIVALNPGILDRTGWEIIDWNSCISEESQYESLKRIPENMLDGNVATFWGSKWDAPKPFPYYFIFDMKKEYKICMICFTKPNDAWRGNLKSGHFEISDDNITWTKLSDWSVDSNVPREHAFVQDGSSARYLKFVISDAFEYANLTTGYPSGARCDVAEFNVVGEE